MLCCLGIYWVRPLPNFHIFKYTFAPQKCKACKQNALVLSWSKTIHASCYVSCIITVTNKKLMETIKLLNLICKRIINTKTYYLSTKVQQFGMHTKVSTQKSMSSMTACISSSSAVLNDLSSERIQLQKCG